MGYWFNIVHLAIRDIWNVSLARKMNYLKPITLKYILNGQNLVHHC